MTKEKSLKIVYACADLMKKSKAPIRLVTHVIGKIVSCFPGVEFGQMHYRILESEKTKAVAASCGNYDAIMTISAYMKLELQ